MIAISPKPRLRKCKVCKEPFAKRSMAHIACSPACAQSLAAQAREKRVRAEYRARRESIKTRSAWLREAQTACNAYIRMRDKLAGHACISCNRPLDWSGNKVDAGHYRSTGSAPHMRFVEANIWAQCKQCNQYGAGRAVDYRIGLIARIGLQAVEALEADQTMRKWSIDELRAIKTHFRAKLKQLKAREGA